MMWGMLIIAKAKLFIKLLASFECFKQRTLHLLPTIQTLQQLKIVRLQQQIKPIQHNPQTKLPIQLHLKVTLRLTKQM